MKALSKLLPTWGKQINILAFFFLAFHFFYMFFLIIYDLSHFYLFQKAVHCSLEVKSFRLCTRIIC